MLTYYPQGPDEVIDYSLDWSAELGSDLIVSSEWFAPEGITLSQASCTETESVIWVGPSSPGQNYQLVNKITTSGGRTREKSIVICVSAFCQTLIDTGNTTSPPGAILLENGGYLLLENGGRLLLDSGVVSPDAFLLESGDYLLLESGGRLLLEDGTQAVGAILLESGGYLLNETGGKILLEA